MKPKVKKASPRSQSEGCVRLRCSSFPGWSLAMFLAHSPSTHESPAVCTKTHQDKHEDHALFPATINFRLVGSIWSVLDIERLQSHGLDNDGPYA
jgi:hypothetical protein